MPPSMPWMKLYSEMLDDPKLGTLSDTLKWRFVEMLLLASESDDGGWICNGDHRLSVQEVAWRLRQPYAKLKIDLEKLVKIRLLESSDAGIFVVNFAKRQGRPSKERREQAKIRQQRFRQTHASRVSNALPDALVTHLEEEVEENRVEVEVVTTDEDFSKVKQCFENNIALLTSIMADTLKDAIKEYSADWIVEAIGEGVKANVRKWSYIEAILVRWKRDGYKADNRGRGGNGNNSGSQHGAVVTKEGEIYV